MTEKNIKVKFFGQFRELSARREYSISSTGSPTVSDALNEIQEELTGLEGEFFDEDGNLLDRVNVFVNGGNIRAKAGLDTVLEAGDKITIFPPFGGG
jgi:molybdopterin synthase sulfur carrier subunit